MLENRSQDKDLYNDMVRLDPLRYEYLTVVLLPPTVLPLLNLRHVPE